MYVKQYNACQGRNLMEIVGEVEKDLGEVQRSNLERVKINEMTYACSVHMYQCINEL
jgi:hypothetical protein